MGPGSPPKEKGGSSEMRRFKPLEGVFDVFEWIL